MNYSLRVYFVSGFSSILPFVFQSGLTPLHVASFMGCMNIVIYLVQNEASPDVTTVRGETPLHLAARANQTDIIRILLRNGAHVSARARVSYWLHSLLEKHLYTTNYIYWKYYFLYRIKITQHGVLPLSPTTLKFSYTEFFLLTDFRT